MVEWIAAIFFLVSVAAGPTANRSCNKHPHDISDRECISRNHFASLPEPLPPILLPIPLPRLHFPRDLLHS